MKRGCWRGLSCAHSKPFAWLFRMNQPSRCIRFSADHSDRCVLLSGVGRMQSAILAIDRPQWFILGEGREAAQAEELSIELRGERAK